MIPATIEELKNLLESYHLVKKRVEDVVYLTKPNWKGDTLFIDLNENSVICSNIELDWESISFPVEYLILSDEIIIETTEAKKRELSLKIQLAKDEVEAAKRNLEVATEKAQKDYDRAKNHYIALMCQLDD